MATGRSIPVPLVADMTLLLEQPADFENDSFVASRPPPPAPLTALRYPWTILLTSVVLMGVGLSAVWLLISPDYSATATIHVAPRVPEVLNPVPDVTGPVSREFSSTQVALIMSSRVLTLVVRDPAVQATAWYRGS